ncbi:MAG: type II toxin-antitoxin system Phd/YefM family antitoxin [Nitrospinae bacterium]|nr:type II toxin-antitoxin system Phd/YefM family antitoxin [Nitrospinota bacterium]
MKTMPIVQARNSLTTLPEQFEKQPGLDAVAVTRRGKPVLAVMPWELYESLVETLEILGDKEMMSSLRKSVKEIEKGKLVPWKKVKREMDF